MATTYKVLGQSAPAATTATTLYTVPASTSAVVSTINVCNRAVTNDTFRVAVRPAGATLATSHYIAFDTAIPANDTISLTIGVSLATTDVITVYAGTANLTFAAFGAEIT
jgi:glucose-6-phosphate dehydrogenase assembly protein OpcA